MSLIQESHDSLPYIDQEATPAERAKADQLITAAIAPEHRKELHPLIPSEPEYNFSPLIQTELDRKAANLPMQGGIDLGRYEAPEAPSSDNGTETVGAWRDTLRKAYASNSYLSSRLANLSLLDEFGKNAWLIGNAQLEDILRVLEKELAEMKEATDNVNKARKAAQEESRGEIVNLEETWKRGIGRILEVEIATQHLRQEIIQLQKQDAR